MEPGFFRLASALFAAAVWLASPGSVSAQSCSGGSGSTISQNDVTFTFDSVYACGIFVNGDYWVAPPTPGGPVTIIAIDPAFSGDENGWEVNPDDPSAQGFDSRINGFDPFRVPDLPYHAAPGTSIVKGISVAAGTCRPCLRTAAILTVLADAPTGGGAEYFRPPYPGSEKPLHRVDRLRTDLLPSLAPVSDTPQLAEIVDQFRKPWLDHKTGWTGRSLHPLEHMPDYGAAIARVTGDGVLRLFLDDPPAAKEEALVQVVQVGIDLYHAYVMGTRWSPDGGHSSGRRLMISFAGLMLDEPVMIDAMRDAQPGDFGEDGSVVVGHNAGIQLWGQPCGGDSAYWQQWRFGVGSKTCADPYGLIDGGIDPGGSYQYCCNSSPWRGHALALRLAPDLRCAWEATDFLAYVDRWVNFGAWSLPDPCAPYDGIPANYGVTYGPDGMSGCIPDQNPVDGIGRFPDNHGINANGGFYGSAFHTSMWDAYRTTAPTPAPCELLFFDGFESGDTGAW